MTTSLYNGRPPFVLGSDTSESASDSIAESAATLRGRILSQIDGSSDGLTCDQLESTLVMRHQTASARVRELVLLKKIVDSGRRRLTRSGRSAVVWMTAPVTQLDASDAIARPTRSRSRLCDDVVVAARNLRDAMGDLVGEDLDVAECWHALNEAIVNHDRCLDLARLAPTAAVEQDPSCSEEDS